MPPSCRKETQEYRNCLKEKNIQKGRSCISLAQTLETCRERFRKANDVATEFDGTRVLPNKKCEPLNKKVQHCLKWKKGVEHLCQEDIDAFNKCMSREKGVVVEPTAGDKVWSDYKNNKKR
mmetsp:Transcript_29988/g.45468  ORF Transcript_29988/g.45468 Transcript_29988/m.45468 type:complete len:121 (-) Transcript_29988:219-581(-)